MGEIIPIHSRRTFSQADVERMLPVVRRITERAALACGRARDELRFVPEGEPLRARIAGDVDLAVRRWAMKISQLGCEPRGLWIVDFDAGDGWFTWRLGDETACFFHPYDAGPAANAPFAEKLTT